MSKPANKITVDLRLVGPRSYSNPHFFNRPVMRGEVVKDIPIDRAQTLLDQFSGEDDNKRFAWETVGKARGVKQNKAGNSQRSEIEYEDGGSEDNQDAAALEATQAELEAVRNQLKEAHEAAAQAQAEAEAAKAEAEAAAAQAQADAEAAKAAASAANTQDEAAAKASDGAAASAEGKPAATARRSTRATK